MRSTGVREGETLTTWVMTGVSRGMVEEIGTEVPSIVVVATVFDASREVGASGCDCSMTTTSFDFPLDGETSLAKDFKVSSSKLSDTCSQLSKSGSRNRTEINDYSEFGSQVKRIWEFLE